MFIEATTLENKKIYININQIITIEIGYYHEFDITQDTTKEFKGSKIVTQNHYQFFVKENPEKLLSLNNKISQTDNA